MTSTATAIAEQPSLLSTLLAETRLDPADGDAYDLVRRGARTLLDDLLRSSEASPRVDRDRVQALIADLDRRLCAQVNLLLHHPEVQQLESAWRGIKLGVSAKLGCQRHDPVWLTADR